MAAVRDEAQVTDTDTVDVMRHYRGLVNPSTGVMCCDVCGISEIPVDEQYRTDSQKTPFFIERNMTEPQSWATDNMSLLFY